jgi:drug/metabolite transporter (DMT)-like permease
MEDMPDKTTGRHASTANRRQSLLFVNVSVLLFGSAGLFAKWIRLPALQLTLGRVLVSFICLFISIMAGRRSFQVSREQRLWLIAAGAMLAIHWWLYAASIQQASVAVGVVTFVSFPLFVTFIEPVFFRERLTVRNVAAALLIIAGVAVTVPEFRLDNDVTRAILLGLISAFAYAVLSLVNRHLTTALDSTVIAFYEQGTASIVLFLLLIFSRVPIVQPTAADIGLIILQGSVMTALAHTLYIRSLKGLTARLAGVISTLEVVYAVLLAWLLLGEVPALRTLAGGVVILAVVIFSQLQPGQPAA